MAAEQRSLKPCTKGANVQLCFWSQCPGNRCKASGLCFLQAGTVTQTHRTLCKAGFGVLFP